MLSLSSPTELEARLVALVQSLASPLAQSLIQNHPNGVALEGTDDASALVPRRSITSTGSEDDGNPLEQLWRWCDGVGAGAAVKELELREARREAVLQLLCDPAKGGQRIAEEATAAAGEKDAFPPPETLLSFLRDVEGLALDRRLPPDPPIDASMSTVAVAGRESQPRVKVVRGERVAHQSPKKKHEVERMSARLGGMARPSESEKRETVASKVVDVGAGQGYLSRALASSPHNLDVLGLDMDEHQTTGALQKQISPAVKLATTTTTGSLVHLTTHIGSPTALLSAIDTWLPEDDNKPPIPILLTGLHACGSLTLSVLRAFVLAARAATIHPPPSPPSPPVHSSSWRPASLAVVPCCYNLITDPSGADIRLTPFARSAFPPGFLTLDHLQLATQDPKLWVASSGSAGLNEWTKARMGIRKVVYRGLVGREIQRAGLPGRETKIGKFPERVLRAGWGSYLAAVGKRLGEELGLETVGDGLEGEERRRTLEFRLEVLTVLRSQLGPLVESLILIDRLLYLLAELDQAQWEVSLEPLFDRATGSLRNMAFFAVPRVRRMEKASVA